ncbi:MAG TPA: hypothetical protein GXZ24_06225 [Firmicutes bacterium]|jgi:DNA-directed RNA polymerase subunit RPC12/RpoP|nr:hypothetical protein [Bacillota bacterium]
MLKKYVLYLIRWQLSTPILAICLYYMTFNVTIKTVLANLIGGLLFFWVDRYIFKSTIFSALWEIKEDIVCVDCGTVTKGYRLVKTSNYDRLTDKHPEFRCEACSKKKLDQLKARGVRV